VSDLARFGVSMDPNLLASFDQWLQDKGYANRSEAVRDLAKQALTETAVHAPDARVAGTITLIYPYQTRLKPIQTSCHPSILISANLQVHLDRETCLKVMVVNGPAADVQELADQLLGMKGVTGRLTVAQADSTADGKPGAHHG